MTKAEIVAKISENTGLGKSEILAVVECFMESVKESLVNGEDVTLRGFGTFMIKNRARKVARNITAEKSVVIPAHNSPFFKPADAFKEKMAPGLLNRAAED